MLTLVLTIAVVGWWALREGTSSGEPIVSSIAVLPLTNLSGDPEQEYFADGMTDALITDLCKIGALRVINRSSVMRYKNTDKSLPNIAQELNVEAVMEGSILREADQVRVSAQLIEAATGNSLWAERYERELSSIIALQGEVAQAIAHQIQVTLTPVEESLLTLTQPVNPEAYEDYLKGQSHQYKFTQPDLETALQYCEMSLEKDPNYAPAYTGIAQAWLGLQQFGYVPRREATPRAKEAILKALELDDTSVKAYSAQAVVKTWMDWDWEGGEAAFRRAIELNPNFAPARAFHSMLLRVMKRLDEAMPEIERALELDPLNPMFQAQYAVVLTSMGRLDEAIEVHRNVLRTVPNHPVALSELEVLLYAKGMYEEALEYGKAAAALIQLRVVEEAMAKGYEETGYLGAYSRAAETLVAHLRADADHPMGIEWWVIAWYYTAAGQKQKALDWLERGFELRHPMMPDFSATLAFKTLHNERRFQELLRRMNFPEDVIARTLNER